MKKIINPVDVLIRYYADKKPSEAYTETNKKYDELRIHANGEYPAALIDAVRPSESDDIKKYRKSTYQPHTKPVTTKIFSSLYKIRRAQDWSIKYDADAMKTIGTIPEEETLQKYCEEKFSIHGSVTNWMFNIALKNQLIDASAVCTVLPEDINGAANEMLKPIATIYNSNQVIDFRENEYAVLLSADKSEVVQSNSTKPGDIYYVFDKVKVLRYEEYYNADAKQVQLRLDVEYIHNLNAMPAFELKGVYEKNIDGRNIYESRIAGIVPRLNEFVTMWSDFKAEIVQHVHSTRWVMATQDCTHCNGSGKLINTVGDTNTTVECPTCKGRQKVYTSPYENIVVVTPTNANQGEAPLPSGPPAGYIQKTDVAQMTTTLNEIIKEQTYYALSAINMEFLAETPLTQSGVAKAQDKDELNNFVHAIAEGLVYVMDKVYFFTNEFRNFNAVPDAAKRKALLPIVTVPEKYDLLSTKFAIEELNQAKTSKLNPIIINRMEIEFAKNKFNYDGEIGEELACMLELDPFPGKNTDEIIAQLQNEGVDKLDYIIWCNLVQFVRQAMEADETFCDLEFEKKKEIITVLAKELQTKNSFDTPPVPPVV